jgi:glycosyltransferase involved in cell wall biosynthesis
MSGKPLVLVIITFCNAEQFLAEAIESVLAQTYDSR